MTSAQKYALESAREITVSKVSSSTMKTDSEYGKSVAEFYEEIYKKIYELASKEEKD